MKKVLIILMFLFCSVALFASGKKDSSSKSSSSSSSSTSKTQSSSSSSKTTSSSNSTKTNTTSSKTTESRPLTQEERDLHKAASSSPTNYDIIEVIERKPTVEEVKDAAKSVGSEKIGNYSDARIQESIDNVDAMSLPNNKVYNPIPVNKEVTAHECEHQSQYQNGDKKEVFETLIKESNDFANYLEGGTNNPYTTPGTYEYEAQKVQERATEILKQGGSK